MKVGKEEIGGLVAAVQRYIALDHPKLLVAWELTVADWAGRLSAIPGVRAERVWPNEAGQPTPRLRVMVERRALGIGGSEVVDALWELDPRVAVLPDGADAFYMTPDTLDEGQAEILIEAVTREISRLSAAAATHVGVERG